MLENMGQWQKDHIIAVGPVRPPLSAAKAAVLSLDEHSTAVESKASGEIESGSAIDPAGKIAPAGCGG